MTSPLNAANILTMMRFVLAFWMVKLILGPPSFASGALLLFLLASLTDYWDGRLARGRNEITAFGILMDPIADKALTLGAFLSFWKLSLLPGVWVAVIVTRDVLVTAFRLTSRGDSQRQAAGTSGKRKTFFQMIYISGVLGYLAVRQMAFWKPAWEETALELIRAGMLVIVILTLWSGVRALQKNLTRHRA